MSSDLDNRVALVTGGSGSIGSAIAQALARRGADVAIHYHEDRGRAERAERSVIALGRRASILAADVRERPQVRALVDEVRQRHGRIDILVNCAGIQRNRPIVTMARKDWDDVIGVNLCGPLYFSQAVAPMMIEGGFGRIINIASITGQTGQSLRANYGASKRGLIGLTRALARALAPHGIAVSAIAPQVVEGGLSKESGFWELRTIKGLTPLNRFARPDEVASLVALLAGDDGAYAAGSVINLTGGLVTWT